MEFEDGKKQQLAGDKAQEWLESVNSVLVMHQARGYPVKLPEWDILEEDNAGAANNLLPD